MKILFISAFNLTTNPRLAKELKHALDLGHTVDFVGIDLGGWSAQIDRQLLPHLTARSMVFLPVTRRPFLRWLKWTLAEKTARILSRLLRKNLMINSLAHSRRSLILWNHLRRQKGSYDLIIAHTLPALYPAYKLSRRHNIPFVFDVEDYHPGEKCSATESRCRAMLMSGMLPAASFITCASPMICQYTLKLIPGYDKRKTCIINNSFEQKDFHLDQSSAPKVRFVWFSQNIAPGRGLEIFIPALYEMKDKVSLTLIGNLYQDFYNDFLAKYSGILTVKPPMPQADLNREICKYDIGLAIEMSSADLNRRLCLTNKIFAYAQAGLYILATDTPAQQAFLEEHKILGTTTPQNTQGVRQVIEQITGRIEQIRQSKAERFEYARRLPWDREKEKLTRLWQMFGK